MNTSTITHSRLAVAGVVAGVLALGLALWCSPVQAGVISHWAFDSDFSDSAGTNDATVAGGTPTINGADSKFGSALDLDGSSHLITGSWGLGGSHTVAAWIKPSNVATDWRGFFGKQQTVGQRVFWLGQSSTDGKIRFGNYFNGTNETSLDTGFAITNGEWYHVAATWNEALDTQTVYINGRPVRQIARTAGTNQVVGNTPLQIGAVGGNIYHGLMDEAWVFDEALSDQQIWKLAYSNDVNASSSRRVMQTEDFETRSLIGWNVVPSPHGDDQVFATPGNMPTKTPFDGFDGSTVQGRYMIRTWEGEVLGNSDGPTGILETDPFVLGPNAQIDFMIGGGNHPFSGDPDAPGANITALNLERQVAPGDWEMVFTRTGINGNYLNPVTWDAGAYAGQTVRLRIYDTATGGWGHLSLDDIRVSRLIANDVDRRVIDDRFDDIGGTQITRIGQNVHGIGSGFEFQSSGSIGTTGENYDDWTGSGFLSHNTSNFAQTGISSKDEFEVLNKAGTTRAVWTTRRTYIDADQGSSYGQFPGGETSDWRFQHGILSINRDNTARNDLYSNSEGGLYVNLFYEGEGSGSGQTDLSLTGNIRAVNKNHPGNSDPESAAGLVTLAMFDFGPVTGGPAGQNLSVILDTTEEGWAFSFMDETGEISPTLTAGSLSGDWTNLASVLDSEVISFTDEFLQGAFVFTEGANIGGGRGSGILEQLTVTVGVPEPATLTLFALGLVALAACGWRRRTRRST